MCICCEIFPACIDRYWEFPEHPCVFNACCYACCGNGLEDPNLAQRIFCQCNTVANYDECGSEPHLISLALCPFLIPGAVYAAFFWEPHYDAERDKALRAFLKHREERKRAAKQAAIEKKKNKRKAERARLKKAAKKEAKENFVEFDEDAWYESLPDRLKKKPHRGSNKVAPEAQEMEFRGLKRGFLLSDSSRPATAATAPSRPPTAPSAVPAATAGAPAPAPAPAPAEKPA